MWLYLRKVPVVIITAGVGFALSGYLFAHELLARYLHPQKSASLGEACADPSIQAPEQNSNKTLFVTCGGFLE